MRRSFSVLFLMTCCAVLSLAAAPGSVAQSAGTMQRDESGFDDEGEGNLNDVRSSGPFALPGGARLESDLHYGSDRLQAVDAYLPAQAHAAPMIVMVHGGAWMRGDKGQWRVVRNKVTHWVAKGYVFVSVNYRMAPQADPLAQADDVARALAYVQSKAASWGADAGRIVLMGHSSGAHLVALLTADPTIAMHQGAAPWLASVALDSAAMNIEQIMRRQHFGFYDRVFGNDANFWRQASPALRLNGKPAAPILVVCSTRRMDSCPQARAYIARAQQAGGRAELLPVDLTHPQINDFLGTPGVYTDGVDTFLHSLKLP